MMSAFLDKPAKEIMSTPVVTVLFSDPVISAVNKMITHDIGAVVVMMGGQPVGIITERDILKRVVLEERNPRTTMCQDVMSKPLITIRLDTPLSEAISIMQKNGIRRLPVVENNEIIGIVTDLSLIHI